MDNGRLFIAYVFTVIFLLSVNLIYLLLKGRYRRDPIVSLFLEESLLRRNVTGICLEEEADGMMSEEERNIGDTIVRTGENGTSEENGQKWGEKWR